MPPLHTKHILVALNLSYSSHRNFLSGIARFLRHAPDWEVSIAEDYTTMTAEWIRRTADSLPDGIITVPAFDARLTGDFRRLTCPVTLVGAPDPVLESVSHRLTVVEADDAAIGALAARHFLELGRFRTYAFVPYRTSTSWSARRFAGFAEELGRAGVTAKRLQSPAVPGSDDDIRILGEALVSFPKPVAVMAAHDLRATQVLQACRAYGLDVPGSVQLIGADNDPVFCDFARPALTSIAINQVRMGEVAAIELNRLLSVRGRHTRHVVIRGAEIAERESTRPTAPGANLVTRALDYIGRNIATGVGPRDVVAHLGVSRSLIDRRFRELEGESLGDVITRLRLTRLRQKLRTTSIPIAKLTADCGFGSPEYAKRLFKRTTGLTMSAFRRQSH